MSREHKYRGLRRDNGEWVKGCLCRFFEDGYYILPLTKAVCSYDAVYKIYEIAGWLKVIPETVGQYIGRKDKNGKEIWEDDICRAEHCCLACFETEPHILTGTIVWGDSMWMFDYGHGSTALSCGEVDEIEIISDIHTTPELMEDK